MRRVTDLGLERRREKRRDGLRRGENCQIQHCYWPQAPRNILIGLAQRMMSVGVGRVYYRFVLSITTMITGL